MYNRYIPQPDGSYRRNFVPDPPPDPPQYSPPPEPNCTPATPEPPHCPPKPQAQGFLQNLLPKNLDTGDLIVILLLLLMAGDNPDDRSTALLTLAIYLFL